MPGEQAVRDAALNLALLSLNSVLVSGVLAVVVVVVVVVFVDGLRLLPRILHGGGIHRQYRIGDPREGFSWISGRFGGAKPVRFRGNELSRQSGSVFFCQLLLVTLLLWSEKSKSPSDRPTNEQAKVSRGFGKTAAPTSVMTVLAGRGW